MIDIRVKIEIQKEIPKKKIEKEEELMNHLKKEEEAVLKIQAVINAMAPNEKPLKKAYFMKITLGMKKFQKKKKNQLLVVIYPGNCQTRTKERKR
ncbi:MAG: hypothetical protein EZS28_041175 [Streblomastix strix]|uniref:Uncharacterized protein n=1 Tax=Streblomastix strix TaxID=222440 RepID=A0A5J4TYU0_9EUKA|nr:MAG: hypothetical protein EZS28_041175 [Streblomastix strix]